MTNPLPEPLPADAASTDVHGSPGIAPDASGPVGSAASPSAAAAPTLAEVLASPAPAPVSAPETPGRLDVTGEWQRVSPKAITIEFLTDGVAIVVIAAAAAVVSFLVGHPWPWFIGGALILVTLVTLAFVPRRIRSIGYLLRDDDLLFRRGIMWQRFVAVPYGRMQLVDINRGPLARAFGLAELKFVTASPATGVTIPGLPLEEAEALRDHLVSVAESRRTGL